MSRKDIIHRIKGEFRKRGANDSIWTLGVFFVFFFMLDLSHLDIEHGCTQIPEEQSCTIQSGTQQRKGQACGGTALSQLSRGRGRGRGGTIVSSKPAGPTQPVPGQPVQSTKPCPKTINIQVNTPVVKPVVAL